jgi:hypothetical protein
MRHFFKLSIRAKIDCLLVLSFWAVNTTDDIRDKI